MEIERWEDWEYWMELNWFELSTFLHRRRSTEMGKLKDDSVSDTWNDHKKGRGETNLKTLDDCTPFDWVFDVSSFEDIGWESGDAD